MKPAPFAYVRPTRLADVVGELVAAEAAGGGKVLAGGQSLVPVLAMRLGRPRTLVDLTRVAELGQIGHDGGSLRIGAAVRQRHVERTAGGDVPLLAQALPWVGHREIRSRGTVCGSLAHADPSAELPAVALCLGATLDVAGPDGRRRIAAEEFFTGAMSTALGPADVLASVQFPLARAGEGAGFAEVARRHGDFALAGVAARVHLTDDGVHAADVATFGVADRPQLRSLRGPLAEAVTRHGTDPDALGRELTEPAAAMAQDVVTTTGDAYASPAYRRRLVPALTPRALARAVAASRKRAAA